MESVDRLGPHLTMLIDGECWTFPLPWFHDSRVTGWGPGQVGAFEQRAWTAEQIAEFDRRANRHERTLRRWGWVRHISLPLWTYEHQGWDEDGEDLGRGWFRTTLGRILAGWLIAPEPMNRGRHLVNLNYMEAAALMWTHGVTFRDNIVMPGPASLAVG